MKLTIGTLLNSVNLEGQIGPFQRLQAMPLKISATLRLKPILRAAQTHINDFVAARNELIKLHGEPAGDDRWEIKVESEKYPEYQAGLDELAASEIEIPGERFPLLGLFTVGQLERDEITMSRRDLDLLEWLIDDGTADEMPAAVDTADNILEMPSEKRTAAA